MAWLLATSPSQPVQLWVTSPTSLARSRATAESGSAATPVATEIAAATAAPARTGRRRSVSRRGGRRTISTSIPSSTATWARKIQRCPLRKSSARSICAGLK